jgi:hypothetical protein
VTRISCVALPWWRRWRPDAVVAVVASTVAGFVAGVTAMGGVFAVVEAAAVGEGLTADAGLAGPEVAAVAAGVVPGLGDAAAVAGAGVAAVDLPWWWWWLPVVLADAAVASVVDAAAAAPFAGVVAGEVSGAGWVVALATGVAAVVVEGFTAVPVPEAAVWAAPLWWCRELTCAVASSGFFPPAWAGADADVVAESAFFFAVPVSPFAEVAVVPVGAGFERVPVAVEPAFAVEVPVPWCFRWCVLCVLVVEVPEAEEDELAVGSADVSSAARATAQPATSNAKMTRYLWKIIVP